MTTFKQYLSEYTEYKKASRTDRATADEIIKWADANASGYLSGKKFLYRGGSGTTHGLMLGNSVTEQGRVSANTNNNYTLWMDNSPLFRGRARRSQSWIGTTKHMDAEEFGHVSIMIVADNAKVGMVGEDDMWHVQIAPKLKTEDWNNQMEQLLTALGLGNNRTYEQLEKSLKAATVEKVMKLSYPKIAYLFQLDDAKNLYEVWENNFTPDHFEFTTGAKVSKGPETGEIWVEGVAAFIPSTMSFITSNERAKLAQWSDKYPAFQKHMIENWNWNG
jgi:hypothetical protein